MKKNILFFAFLLVCLLDAMAQDVPQTPISPEDRTKMFVEHISPKLNLTKGQKDTLAIIFVQFMDDIQKYPAENSAKVITFMMKTRDEKVKNLLRDTVKYNKYILLLEDIKKQRDSQRGSMQQGPPGGHRNNMEGDRTF